MNTQNSHASSDVLVVGAGPIGLLCALRLADLGWTVTVVERWPDPYGQPRAVSLDSESLRTLQTVNLADEMTVPSRSLAPDIYDWRNAEGKSLLIIDRRAPGPSGWSNIIFSQPDLELLLEERAQAHTRINIMRGVEVADADAIFETTDSVQVEISDTFTHEPRGALTARYVIGADGANSVVRARIGEPMVDLGFFFDWLVVDIIPTDDREWETKSIQICSPERPTTFIPGGPGRRRWEFMSLPGESVEELGTEAVSYTHLDVYKRQGVCRFNWYRA